MIAIDVIVKYPEHLDRKEDLEKKASIFKTKVIISKLNSMNLDNNLNMDIIKDIIKQLN